MTECYRDSRVCMIDRLSNDELGALIAGVVADDECATQKLFAAVEPLLKAFYEGQVQAERARHEHLEGLVQEAFMTVYQRCATYDTALSIRAWVIDIARCKLIDHLRSHRTEAALDHWQTPLQSLVTGL